MGTIAEINSKIKYNPGLDTNAENWINLHRNENLFIDESVIKDIVMKAVKETSILKYPDPSTSKVRKIIAEHHGVSPDNIFVGNGADEVLASLFYFFRKRFERVNLPRICFKMYETLAAKYDFTLNQFLNFPALESDFSDSGLYIIDSPSSITGEVIPEDMFSNLISNPGNMVIWDNVHGDFRGENKFELQNNLIVVKHFSHYYGLASLRIGYCIAPKEIVDEMNTFREPFSVNGIAQAAAIECLNQKNYFEAISKQIKQSRIMFETELKKIKFDLSNSEVNYVLVKHRSISSEFIHQQLAARKIATRHYADDSVLNYYLRITVPSPNDYDRVIQAIKEIVLNDK